MLRSLGRTRYYAPGTAILRVVDTPTDYNIGLIGDDALAMAPLGRALALRNYVPENIHVRALSLTKHQYHRVNAKSCVIVTRSKHCKSR